MIHTELYEFIPGGSEYQDARMMLISLQTVDEIRAYVRYRFAGGLQRVLLAICKNNL